MELHQIRYFIAVAEELHFGRAAARENVSQPPLSFQIKKLEQELGVDLFHRTKRRVELSAAGTAFLPEARRVLADLVTAAETAKKAHRGESGALTIGFVHSAAFDYLPRLIGPFRRKYPEIELGLLELTVSEQVRELTEGKIDIGIVRPPVREKGLASYKMVHEPFSVAVPVLHPLSAQHATSLQSLAEEDFVFYPEHRSPAFHHQLLTMCSEAGFMPRIAVVANTIHTAVGMVGTGAGVALVPNCVRCIQLPSVRFLDLTGTKHMAELTLVHADQTLPPACRKLVDYARGLG